MSDALLRTPMMKRRLPAWMLLAGGALAYFAAARAASGLFQLQPESFTLLWLPIGIALVMFRQFGAKASPYVFVAALAHNLPDMGHPEPLRYLLHAALGAGIDTAGVMLGAVLLRRALPEGLGAPSDLFRFLGVVALPCVGFITLGLTLNLLAGGYLPPEAAWGFMVMLLLSDALGLLLVVPLVEAWRRHGAPTVSEWRDWVIVVGCLAVMSVLAFRAEPGLIFLVIPGLVWLLFRAREQLALLGLVVTMILLVGLAAEDMGPFAVGTVEQNRVMVVSFLFTTTLVVLALMLQERRFHQTGAERDRWRFHAEHDALTGLANRPGIEGAIEKALERVRLGEPAFCLALIDIDHFKQVNDRHGHRAGDEVLRVLAARLRQGVRNVDRVGRIGGEEFVVLFPGLDLPAAVAIVERLRATMAASPIHAGGIALPVTISAGVVSAGGEADATLEGLLTEADRRLYVAKDGGRNRVIAN